MLSYTTSLSLEQLGDSVWAEHLLPKLQRSLASVALTCRQLRRLCQCNQRSLKLTLGDLDVQALGLLPDHFPGCSTVLCTAQDEPDVGQMVRVLPVLAR